MMTEKGELPFGVEFDGQLWRGFELRPLKMRDSVESRSSADAERIAGDDELAGLYLLARRLTIHGIPREALTIDFMLEMWDEDIKAVLAADARLANAMRRFRREAAAAAAGGVGVDEGGLQLSGGYGDGGGGGRGVAGCLDGDQKSPVEEGADVSSSAAGEGRL